MFVLKTLRFAVSCALAKGVTHIAATVTVRLLRSNRRRFRPLPGCRLSLHHIAGNAYCARSALRCAPRNTTRPSRVNRRCNEYKYPAIHPLRLSAHGDTHFTALRCYSRLPFSIWLSRHHRSGRFHPAGPHTRCRRILLKSQLFCCISNGIKLLSISTLNLGSRPNNCGLAAITTQTQAGTHRPRGFSTVKMGFIIAEVIIDCQQDYGWRFADRPPDLTINWLLLVRRWSSPSGTVVTQPAVGV